MEQINLTIATEPLSYRPASPSQPGVASPASRKRRRRRPCPRCQGRDVMRAHRRGLFEPMISVLGYYPFYCYRCGHHFFRRRARLL